jgi:hypothetical protein
MEREKHENESAGDDRMRQPRETKGDSSPRRRLPRDCRRIAALLPALPDGELRPSDARRVEAHLAVCADCRREAELFARLGDLVRQAGAAEPSLPSGEAAVGWILQQGDGGEASARTRRRPGIGMGLLGRLNLRRPSPLIPALGLALAAGAVVGFLLLRPGRPTTVHLVPGDPGRPTHQTAQKGDPHSRQGPPSPRVPPDRTRPRVAQSQSAWSVARLAGAPLCGSERIRESGRLRVGEWLETDKASKASIRVANIGHVEIQPNTRIRLVETRPHEHRLSMARGGLQARIKAPPRLFFVETPSAVAVDLGCAYTLNVDDTGRSVLHVTSGWVALVRDGRESIVSEGSWCETRKGMGLGTPYREDSPRALREALTAFDFEKGGEQALRTVLTAAREPDSLTLWHLLSRATPTDRGRVHDRLKALVPPPRGVTREGILHLDPKMLDRWREEIEVVLWSADLGLPG